MKKISRISIINLLLILIATIVCSACGKGNQNTKDVVTELGLTHEKYLDIEYAKEFQIEYFEEGYKLITIHQDEKYLIEPKEISENNKVNEKDVEALGVTLLKQPLENVYLVASAVMDMQVSLGTLDNIRFSSVEENGWYIDVVKEKMKENQILYAGKYSAPDYELIKAEGCGLAIENTMIYHSPKIKEELESFGIPVLVDYSSYENNPLGRMEWIKLYGELFDSEQNACEIFDEKKNIIQNLQTVSTDEKDKATVAFFYITSNGTVSVRKTTDYVSKMIEMAGGKYIFDKLPDEEKDASSSVNMQIEEFYANAKNADYIIYNSTIEGELNSLNDFLSLSPLLKEFKAVKDNNVYCTTSNLYQSSMELGDIIIDINSIITGEDESLKYIYKLN